jgi:hypothetical protein
MKVIDYQNIDLSDAEWGYYQELVKQIGVDDFRGLFKTDEQGIITQIAPTKPVAWVAIFWVQNCMLNQRLREQDRRIEELEKQQKEYKENK